MIKCKSCGKEYETKVEACECGHTEFDEVVKPDPATPPPETNPEVEMLKKQIEMMNKQMELIQTNADAEKKKLEQEKEAERIKNMSEQDRLEHEKQKQQQEVLDQQAKILGEMEKIKTRNEELEKENKEREFKNKKLILSNDHPYLKDKIGLCENQNELDYLFKFVNVEEEKAKFNADNASGSVLEINGVIPTSQISAPKTIGEKLNAMKEKKLQELKEKRRR